MILCLYIERYFRIGSNAKNLERTEEDKGTTRLIGLIFVLSLIILALAPILEYLSFGILYPEDIFLFLGLSGMIIGVLIRIEAVRELGIYYTSVLKTFEDQNVIQDGMYRYIRHPGYLGNLILFISAAIAVRNFIIIVLILLILIPSYLKRIQSEELMLIKKFGNEYLAYKACTRKLIPLLF